MSYSCLTSTDQLLSQLSWREQDPWDDDDVRFVLDQHDELDSIISNDMSNTKVWSIIIKLKSKFCRIIWGKKSYSKRINQCNNTYIPLEKSVLLCISQRNRNNPYKYLFYLHFKAIWSMFHIFPRQRVYV